LRNFGQEKTMKRWFYFISKISFRKGDKI